MAFVSFQSRKLVRRYIWLYSSLKLEFNPQSKGQIFAHI